LEVRGGRSQAIAGPLLDGGVLAVGAGSTLAVSDGYRQVAPGITDLALDGHLSATTFAADAGSLLRARLAPTATAPLQAAGAATLAGTLDLATPAGTTLPPGDLPLISATPVGGAFSLVTGTEPGYQVVAGPAEVHVHVPGALAP